MTADATRRSHLRSRHRGSDEVTEPANQGGDVCQELRSLEPCQAMSRTQNVTNDWLDQQDPEGSQRSHHAHEEYRNNPIKDLGSHVPQEAHDELHRRPRMVRVDTCWKRFSSILVYCGGRSRVIPVNVAYPDGTISRDTLRLRGASSILPRSLPTYAAHRESDSDGR